MSRTLPPYYRRIEQAVRQQRRQQEGRGAPRRDGSRSLFYGDAFVMELQEGWQNETVYVLEGPVEDDLQHTLLEVHDEGIPIKERPRTGTARGSTSLMLSPLLPDGLLDPAVVWRKRPWHGTQ